MPIEAKIATVGKSYSALDFQANVVVCVNGGAKVYKFLDNIQIIAASRYMRPHKRHDPIHRQHSRIFCLVNVVGVRKKLHTLVKNSAFAMPALLP